MSEENPRQQGREAVHTRVNDGPQHFVTMVVLDVAAPLALYYLLRFAGTTIWTAVIIGSLIPAGRLITTAVKQRRLEQPALLTVVLLAVGTAIGVVTHDPRLLMVRESYLTAIVGGWVLLSLRSAQPLVMTATLRFLPAEERPTWQQAWRDDDRFRQLMRG